MLAPDALAWGVTADALPMAFSYQFVHASWRHLLVNSLSLALMFNPIFGLYEKRFEGGSKLSFFLAMYAGSVLAALFTATSTPTVGASGMAFFLLGVFLILQPTMRTVKNFIFVGIAILVQIIRGNSNVALHIVAFVFGCLYIIITLLCKKEYLKSENLD